jgi:GR25 family glycosyltransferase involved in LPS biosynthesis
MTDFFDKIFVINLEERSDRLERVSDVLHFLDIPFERYSAIHKDSVTGIFNKFITQNPDSTITRPGYIACLLSHLSVYKIALDRGYKKILVLEDDIFVHKNVKALIQTFFADVPNDWDMIHFGYLPLSDDLQMWSHNNFKHVACSSGMVFRSKGLWCCHAYAIKSEFMKETLEVYNTTDLKEWKEIDRYFVELQSKNFESFLNNNKRNFYGCFPSLFGQVASMSDLSPGFYSLDNEQKFISICRSNYM